MKYINKGSTYGAIFAIITLIIPNFFSNSLPVLLQRFFLDNSIILVRFLNQGILNHFIFIPRPLLIAIYWVLYISIFTGIGSLLYCYIEKTENKNLKISIYVVVVLIYFIINYIYSVFFR